MYHHIRKHDKNKIYVLLIIFFYSYRLMSSYVADFIPKKEKVHLKRRKNTRDNRITEE